MNFTTLLLASSLLIAPATQTATSEPETPTTYLEENVQRAFTNISASLTTTSERVVAHAQNNFTLFPTTVHVYIELYSSTLYASSYRGMELTNSNYIIDLDMGESIAVSAPINGQQRFWQARAYYQEGNGAWKEVLSDIFLIDTNGNVVPY